MAILSGLLRTSRFAEIVGCPLDPAAGAHAPAAGRSEDACRACPYNVLAPGHARVGCTIATPAAHYTQAFEQLRARAPAAAAEVERLLAEQRSSVDEPLDTAAAARLAALAEHWPAWFEAGTPASTVTLTLLAFARYAATRGEPARVLA